MSVFTLLVLLIWDFSQRSLIYASHKPFATCRRLLRVCLHNKFHVAFLFFILFLATCSEQGISRLFRAVEPKGFAGM